jgi:hypothetical protein
MTTISRFQEEIDMRGSSHSRRAPTIAADGEDHGTDPAALSEVNLGSSPTHSTRGAATDTPRG